MNDIEDDILLGANILMQDERGPADIMLSSEIINRSIRPSTSPWASPLVLFTKKDVSQRTCVDYRKVNALSLRMLVLCKGHRTC